MRAPLSILVVALSCSTAGAARAQAEPPASSAAAKAAAKARFDRGVAYFEREAWSAALTEFSASRAIFPTTTNTLNAALCLGRLGRWDESLELLETLRPQTTGAEHASLEREIAAVGARVAFIDVVGTTIDGTLTVDGRERGQVKAGMSVPVLPGSHVIRVQSYGFDVFERSVSAEKAERVALRIDLTSEACETGAQRGKELAASGKLREAASRYGVCARPACPAPARTACENALREVDARIPSILVAVKDAQARDAVGANVYVDGAPLETREGKAFALDVGKHTIRVELAKHVPYEANVDVREGEKERSIAVALVGANETAGDAGASRRIHVATWALAGGAVLALGGSAFLWAKGSSQRDDLEKCFGHCTESEVRSAETSLNWARVTLVAGGALAASAVASHFLLRRSTPSATISWGVSPSTDGVRGNAQIAF